MLIKPGLSKAAVQFYLYICKQCFLIAKQHRNSVLGRDEAVVRTISDTIVNKSNLEITDIKQASNLRVFKKHIKSWNRAKIQLQTLQDVY